MTSKGLQAGCIQGALREEGKDRARRALTADLPSMLMKFEELAGEGEVGSMGRESTVFLPWFEADFVETRGFNARR